jgi:class 3 adenylate cyclase
MINKASPDGRDESLRLTVLFADIADSTQLYQQLGNDRALQMVEHCMSRLESIALGQDGQVIKTVGDEIMCKFPTPEAAVQAAIEMQLDRPEQGGPAALQLRIGLQHGELIERYGDVFGDTVNVAARLTSIAKPRQILTTVETVSELPADLREATRQHEGVVLKGIADEVGIAEILWQQDESLTMMGDTELARENRSATLTLSGPDGNVVVGRDLNVVTLGRDADCTILITHPKASRNHARIEHRRNNFVLIDRSTNGTWVCFDLQAPFRLRLEEAVLRGSGSISFGESPDSETAQTMRFEVA